MADWEQLPDEIVAFNARSTDERLIRPGETHRLQVGRDDTPSSSAMRIVIETSNDKILWDVTGYRDFTVDALDEPRSLSLRELVYWRVYVLRVGGSDSVRALIKTARNNVVL